ncbi:hypothetical protein REIP_0991 [Rickettsia endosymbiont of Ixodes pacificus]|nr:hypothetical protein REIP_0991 [Rickettsia endosymbiont of Ixodes pacificus]
MSDEAINHVNNDGETALSIATKNGLRIIARSTCDLLLKMIDKLNNTDNINLEDKERIIEKILIKIQKLEYNNVILQEIAKSIKNIISKNKITKGQLIDLEDEIEEAVQQQYIADKHLSVKLYTGC